MQAKNAFTNQQTVNKYAQSIINVGLWKSEEFLINKYIKKEAQILDLGCGCGRTTFWLYQLGWKNIIGADISKAMIKKANEINQKLKFNLQFLSLDAANLTFKTNTFDFVLFSFNGWTGIPKKEARIKAMQEIYRVLKPGGIFIFYAHERNETQYNLRYKINFAKCQEYNFNEYGDYVFLNEEGIWDYMHLYSLKELKYLINKNTNFQIIEILNRDQNLNEPEEVLNFSDNTTFWVLQKTK